MQDRSSQKDQARQLRNGSLGNPLFDGIALGKIVDFDGRHPIIAGTSLIPSQPGCEGDTGTVLENRVTDVIREPKGLMHVIEGKLDAEVGDLVLIRRDAKHRSSLERTHTATVLLAAELARRGIEVAAVEIVAGMAWIEVCGPAPYIDLTELASRDLPLAIRPRRDGKLSVDVGGLHVTTYFAPLCQNSLDVGAGVARAITRLEDGSEVLEVRLADESGRG